MIDWNIYERRIFINGITQKERLINSTKDELKKKSIDLPSYKNVYILDINKNIGLTIINTNTDKIKKISNFNKDILSLGMIINWDNSYWMITSLNFNDEMYQSGFVQQCNFKLCYQNNSPTVLEQWCIITNTYSEISSKDKVISVPIGKTVIWLPYNNNTKKIYKDKRILFEKSYDKDLNEIAIVYKVTGIDSKFYDYGNGKIITLTFESDGYSVSNDNLTQMICDYIEPVSSPAPNINLLNCFIDGVGTVRMGGTIRNLTAIFYTSDGITIDNTVVPVWTVSISDSYTSKIHYESIGNSISIWTDDFDDILGEIITVSLSDSGEKYNITTKILEVV